MKINIEIFTLFVSEKWHFIRNKVKKINLTILS